jgi:hypothetical protein
LNTHEKAGTPHLDFIRGRCGSQVIVQIKVEARGEAHGPQHPQRIVQERHTRVQRSANEPDPQVVKALQTYMYLLVSSRSYFGKLSKSISYPLRKVFDLSLRDIVEQRVDRKVAALGVLQWRTELDVWDAVLV